MSAGNLKDDLQTLAESRVFFGHQSVGRDILQGMESLAKEAGADLRIVDVSKGGGDTLPGLFHANVGANTKPDTKCASFSEHLGSSADPGFDAALLKFCYVDLGNHAVTEAPRLLEMYGKLVKSVREAHPGLALIHATIPLKSDPLSMKGKLKRILGRETDNDAENLLRNRYNELLAAQYGNELFFDLAKAQSTLPDGRRTGFKRDGKTVYTLAGKYTYDEGHLNDEGRAWVAREFARVVADAVRKSRSRLTQAGQP